MAVAAVTLGGGLLDAVGKQILQFAEYRIVGVLIGLVVIAFVVLEALEERCLAGR